MVIGLAAFAFLGYVVCLVSARRCHRDIGGFRRSLWVGYGNRDHWRTGASSATSASTSSALSSPTWRLVGRRSS